MPTAYLRISRFLLVLRGTAHALHFLSLRWRDSTPLRPHYAATLHLPTTCARCGLTLPHTPPARAPACRAAPLPHTTHATRRTLSGGTFPACRFGCEHSLFIILTYNDCGAGISRGPLAHTGLTLLHFALTFTCDCNDDIQHLGIV